MTLPVPKFLAREEEKKAEPGTAVIQAIRHHRVQVECPPGAHPRYVADIIFRGPLLTIQFFSRTDMFPLSFPSRLETHLKHTWRSLGLAPSDWSVVVEWVEEVQSFCARVFQLHRTEEQTDEWAERVVLDFLSPFERAIDQRSCGPRSTLV